MSTDIAWDDEPIVDEDVVWDDTPSTGPRGVLNKSLDLLTSGSPMRNIYDEGSIGGGLAKTGEQIGGSVLKAVQGLTRNWGDEIAAKAVGLFTDEDTEASALAKIREFERAFEEENPGRAFLSEGAGGIIGPGKFAKPGGYLKRAWNALEGTAEGAIAGAGAADEGDRLSGAVRGGSLGLGLDTALGAGRFGANRVAKRRIQQALGDDMPITMTDDAPEDSGWLKRFYNEWVGDAYGGKSSLYRQEQAVRDRVAQQADEATSVVTDIEAGATERALGETEQLRRQQQRITERVQDRADKRVLDKSMDKLDKTRDLNQRTQAAADEYEQIIGDDFGADVARTQQTIKQNAMPESMDDETRQVLTDMDDPQAFYTGLRKWWKDSAFGSVTQQRWDVSDTEVNKLAQDIYASVEDPKLLKELGDVDNDLQALLYELGDETDISRLTGEDLMDFRNGIARGSRFKAKGEAALSHAERRSVVNTLDDFISARLDPEDAAKFANDKQHYTAYLALRDTLEDPSVVKAGGDFDADKYLSKYINYNPRTAAEGKMLSQADLVTRNQAQQQLPDSLRESRKAVAASKAQEVDQLAEDRIRESAADLERTRGRRRKVSQGVTAREEAIAARRAAPEGLPQAKAAQEAAQAEVDNLKGRGRSSGTGGSFARTAAFAPLASPVTWPIGSVAGPMGGAIVTAGGGAAVASALASRTAQKVLAGQTVPQEVLNKWLAGYDASVQKQIVELLRRGTTVAGAGE